MGAGFLKRAERISLDLRRQMGLRAQDCLDPFALAQHLDVGVRRIDELRNFGLSDEDITTLVDSKAGFSALTVWRSSRPLIIYNPTHSSSRTANDVCHELSHIYHDHPPRPAIGFGGCREWDELYEQEAVWQAATLLVPRDGAFSLVQRGGTLAECAAHFGVSVALFRWRAHQTGVFRVNSLIGASRL